MSILFPESLLLSTTRRGGNEYLPLINDQISVSKVKSLSKSLHSFKNAI